MATNLSGSTHKATPNTVKAMKHSAEGRQCPDCGRRSALVWHHGEFVSALYCRWSREDKCSRSLEQRIRERISQGFTPVEEVNGVARRWRYELAEVAPAAGGRPDRDDDRTEDRP